MSFSSITIIPVCLNPFVPSVGTNDTQELTPSENSNVGFTPAPEATSATTSQMQVTNQLRVDGHTDLAAATSTNFQATGQVIIDGHLDTQSVTSTILEATEIHVSASSTIHALSLGTTTLPTVLLNVVGAGTSTIQFGDASSSKPYCAHISMFPTGTVWAYQWVELQAGVATLITTSTPC